MTENTLNKTTKKQREKKKMLLFVILTVVICAAITTSFALWQLTLKQTDKNVITTACFNVKMMNESDSITLDNAYPVTDEDGMKNDGYTFSIKNVCSSEAYYQVNLEELTTELKQLSGKYIKVSLNDSKGKNLYNYTSAENTLENALSARKLTTGKLNAEEEVTYTLKLWMDKDTPAIDEVMNASFNSKITIVVSSATDNNQDDTITTETESKNDSVSKDDETITITIKNDKPIIEYSTDGENFIKVPPNTEITFEETFTEEGPHTIYIKDEDGNIKEVIIDTPNLDQTAPSTSVTSKDKDDGSGLELSVKIEDEKSNLSGYQITTDNIEPTEWISISGKDTTITFDAEKDKLYYIWTKDELGNVTSHKYYTDVTAPTLNLSLGTKLTINATDNLSGITAYSVSTKKGSYSWINVENNPLSFTKELEITENGLLYVSVKDYSNNITTKEIDTSLIDVDAPTITSVSGNPNNWTKDNVTLTINGANDTESGLHNEAYSFDNGSTWQKENTKTYTENTSNIIIKVRDNLGNTYTHEAIDITKIDKTAPTITNITGNPTSWASSATLTINGANDSESGLDAAPYSFDNGTTWQEENTKTFTGNTNNIIIKVRDKAGNTYTHENINITKIDSANPTQSFAIASSTNGENGWYKALSIKVTTSDSQSGVKSAKYCVTTSSTCTPSTNATLSNNTFTVKITENKSAQKVCANTTDNVNKTSDTTCSTAYKVDSSNPSGYLYSTTDFSSITASVQSENDKISGISSQYYFSKDAGKTWVTSETSTYTFTRLEAKAYPIIAKIKDIAGNEAILTLDYGAIYPGTNAVKYLNSIKDSTNLVNDNTTDNNLRYIGSNPNNYARLSSGTSVRIVGVMNNVEGYDGTKASRIKVEFGADITTFDTNNSNYWPNASSNGVLGNWIEDPEYLIDEVKWYISKIPSYTTFNTAYTKERTYTPASGYQKTWVGSIAPLYWSDLVFMSGSVSAISTRWLYPKSNVEEGDLLYFTLTACEDDRTLYNNNGECEQANHYNHVTTISAYLRPGTKITGKGTSSNPYILSYE